MNKNVICIHGIKKDGVVVCHKCLGRKLGLAFSELGITAGKAATQMKAAIDLIPQEQWDLIDLEFARREKETKRRKNIILFYILSFITFFGIMIWYVIVES